MVGYISVSMESLTSNQAAAHYQLTDTSWWVGVIRTKNRTEASASKPSRGLSGR